MGNADVAQSENLLIAMTNTQESLKLIQSVADREADLAHLHVTLMHYLVPIYWEHGGDTSDEQELQEILREERRVLRTEEMQEKRSRDYFQEAKAILVDAGVPAENIHSCLTSDGADVAEAILQEIKDGHFTAVVVGQQDRSMIEEMFEESLGEFLKRNTSETKVWEIPVG
ncbi:MAG: universal stress protein [Caldilineaceae bacterium]